MPYVYLLQSKKDNKTYLGSTNDLVRRLKEHDDGKVIATKNRRPLILVYSENYATLIEARIRERFLKTTSGRRELRKLLNSILNTNKG